MSDQELFEAFEMAHTLMQEAKGVEGPNGGFVTDHLDAAEGWLDKIEAHLREIERREQAANLEVLRRSIDLDAANKRAQEIIDSVELYLKDRNEMRLTWLLGSRESRR